MNRYTVLVNSDKLKDVITIPSEFEHKQVEVVISLHRSKKFNPRKFRGVCNATKESIDKELKLMRGDWE